MNRLPSELRVPPPPPRSGSVTSSPRTDSGQTMWVGWNCRNSMLSRVAPASSASACPSPVYSQEFEEYLKVLPIPPVARIMILATGGIGKTFKYSSNSWEYTGDGHALALLAGATLLNMEFLQFHPTHMVWPLSVRGLLVTEPLRGGGGGT